MKKSDPFKHERYLSKLRKRYEQHMAGYYDYRLRRQDIYQFGDYSQELDLRIRDRLQLEPRDKIVAEVILNTTQWHMRLAQIYTLLSDLNETGALAAVMQHDNAARATYNSAEDHQMDSVLGGFDRRTLTVLSLHVDRYGRFYGQSPSDVEVEYNSSNLKEDDDRDADEGLPVIKDSVRGAEKPYLFRDDYMCEIAMMFRTSDVNFFADEDYTSVVEMLDFYRDNAKFCAPKDRVVHKITLNEKLNLSRTF